MRLTLDVARIVFETNVTLDKENKIDASADLRMT